MRKALKLLIVLVVIAGMLWLLRASASFLTIDEPQKSDALIVLAGDENDIRFHLGDRLLREGYAGHMFVDAENTVLNFGKTQAQHAEDFLAWTHPDEIGRISICSIAADSTAEEIRAVGPCLKSVGAHKVLIVTSDFHTRRSLSVAKKLLPQYQWSVSAARTAASQPKWWRNRWALKNVLLEYEKLVFWKVVESHL